MSESTAEAAAASEQIALAAKALRAGGVIILPTDTVYGLGADARCPVALRRLCAVKQRTPEKAFPVLLGEQEEAGEYAETNEAARLLIERFWPGALTLVLRARRPSALAPPSLGPDGTVGLRVPADPVARAIISQAGCPLAAPSANRPGEPPPRTAAEARAALGDLVDVVVDAGECRVGRPSTVLSVVGEPTVLRAGAVSIDELSGVLGREVSDAARTS
jgi:L-threonylcarbamoyladenylate synthase